MVEGRVAVAHPHQSSGASINLKKNPAPLFFFSPVYGRILFKSKSNTTGILDRETADSHELWDETGGVKSEGNGHTPVAGQYGTGEKAGTQG
jgi:hypothetical protein